MARNFTDSIDSNVLNAEDDQLGRVRQAHGDHATVESTTKEQGSLTDEVKHF